MSYLRPLALLVLGAVTLTGCATYSPDVYQAGQVQQRLEAPGAEERVEHGVMQDVSGGAAETVSPGLDHGDCVVLDVIGDDLGDEPFMRLAIHRGAGRDAGARAVESRNRPLLGQAGEVGEAGGETAERDPVGGGGVPRDHLALADAHQGGHAGQVG